MAQDPIFLHEEVQKQKSLLSKDPQPIPIEEALKKNALMINNNLTALLPNPELNKNDLVMAMYYSCITNAKRLRPFITMTIASYFQTNKQQALDTACIVEFIHVYSLIHDDLPAMDDDDFRRGKPSCHKRYNESTAILAGDALLTHAFAVVADSKNDFKDDIKSKMIAAITKAIGFEGIALGQFLDLDAKNKKISAEEIMQLHKLKTSKMFILASELACILAENTTYESAAFAEYANMIGLILQIKDDILDFEESQINPDKKPDNVNIVNVIGMEESLLKLEELRQKVKANMTRFGENPPQTIKLLEQVADFIIDKSKH